MILYHGSDHIIRHPEYRGGRRHNDYGYGFYCTEAADMAREWSAAPDRSGYLNQYEFEMKGLNVLDLKEYSILTWLAILLQNRTFQLNTPLSREAYRYILSEFNIDYKQYDVIVGSRADDSYFSFAQDFVNGVISLDQLSEAMGLGELGEQIVLKSRRAYEHIEFTGGEEVDHLVWYPRRAERDKSARKAYHSTDKGYEKGAVYIYRIIDEEMKRDDVRLR